MRGPAVFMNKAAAASWAADRTGLEKPILLNWFSLGAMAGCGGMQGSSPECGQSNCSGFPLWFKCPVGLCDIPFQFPASPFRPASARSNAINSVSALT